MVSRRLDKKCGKSGIPDNQRCTKRTAVLNRPVALSSSSVVAPSPVNTIDAKRTRLLLGVAGGVAVTTVLGVLANDVFTKGIKPDRIPPKKPPKGLYDSFQPGDLIYNSIDFLGARRAHYAVYVGKLNGVHTVFDISGSSGFSKARLRSIDIAVGNGSSFAPASRLRTIPTSKPSADHLMRIIEQLEGKSFSYDGYNNNCETFARSVVGDLPVSTQGRKVTGMTRAIVKNLLGLVDGGKLSGAELNPTKIRTVVRRTKRDNADGYVPYTHRHTVYSSVTFSAPVRVGTFS